MGAFTRMFSPLRHIDVKPEDLVLEAHKLLEQADWFKERELWEPVTAMTSMATAKVQLAAFLKEHHS